MTEESEPALPLPPGTCDCHVHVFGDVGSYPPAAGATYAPPPQGLAELRAMREALGIERTVIVQPSVYKADNRLLLDALKGRDGFRGIAVVDDTVEDRDLEALHAAGARGARFALGGSIQAAMDRRTFERSVARISALGWHVKIGGGFADILERADWLRGLRVPVLLDHLAGVTPEVDPDGQDFRRLLGLVADEGMWVLLANPDRRSAAGPPWTDMTACVSAFIEAAPNRTVWGSDWPHILYGDRPPPDEAELLRFLRRAAPDAAAFRRILVDNPARLYGFDP